MKHTIRKTMAAALLGFITFHASADTKVYFYGESTFRGYEYGAERDNPTPTTRSNTRPAFQFLQPKPDRNASNTADTQFNVPRRVAERAAGWPYYVPITRVNRAVSGSPIELLLNGGQDMPAPFRYDAANSAAGVVVVNMGINNAVSAADAKIPRATAKQNFYNRVNDLAYQAQRTGKKLIFLLPNPIGNANYRNDYLNDLKTQVQNVKNLGYWNMEIVQNPVSISNVPDSIHPNETGYIQQAQALVPYVADAALTASRQQRICQLYVGFFNRVAEAEGAAYWYTQLISKGEAHVANVMYSIAPGYGNVGLTGPALITKYYQNVFSRNPDSEGLAFWERRRQIVGNGPVLLEILNAAATANNSDTLILAQKVNVSMTYGFILNRTPVNTTALLGINGDPQKVLDKTMSF